MGADLKKDYKVLLNELKSYNTALGKKKKIVAITKMDAVGETERKQIKKLTFGRGVPVHCISAVSGEGIAELLDEIWNHLQ